MHLLASRRLNAVKSHLNTVLATPDINKAMKDNLSLLATVIAWNLLTSLVPVVVGLIAISGLILTGDRALQHSVVAHLSTALRGVFKPGQLNNMVRVSIRHSGLFGVIGMVGVLWGGSNVGGAISTAFQPIFETGGRNFVKERLLDVGMIFVIATLLAGIIAASTYTVFVNRLVSSFPLSGAASQVAGSLVDLAVGFVLFATIYIAFPNTERRLEIRHVWVGALVAAVLLDLLSLAWPIYAHFARFSQFGAILVPILVLTAWLYFFSLILVTGAEFVAIAAIGEANRRKLDIGPEPENVVPQHTLLRRE